MYAEKEQAEARMEETERALRAAAEAQRQREMLMRAATNISADSIGASAYTFYSLSQNARQNIAGFVPSASSGSIWLSPGGLAPVLQDVYDNALTMSWTPYFDVDAIPGIASAKQAATDAVNRASATAGPVVARLQAAQNDLEQAIFDAESELERMQAFRSPVTGANLGTLPTLAPDGTITGQPTFSVDEAAAQQQRQTVADAQAQLDALDTAYREALVKTLDEIAKVDLAFHGEVSFDYQLSTASPSSAFSLLSAFSQPPSVNTAAAEFRDAVQKMQFYDARVAGQLWSRQESALAYKQTFVDDEVQSIRAAIDAQIARVMAATSGGTTPFAANGATPYREAAWAASRAVKAVLDPIDPSRAQAQSQDVLTSLSQRGWSAQGRRDYERIYKQHLYRYWIDFPRMGLQRVADTLGAQAAEIQAQSDRAMAPLLTAYANLTNEIDDMYALKAELATVAYGMAEDYQQWRQDRQAVSAQSGYALASTGAGVSGLRLGGARVARPPLELDSVLTSLEISLEPPTVAFLSVDRNTYSGLFSSTVTLGYGANAPAGGDVVEYSYSLDRSGRDGIYATGQFYTTGKSTSLWLYPYKESEYVDEHDYAFTIRARTAGGLVAIRRGTFTAQVDHGGGSSGRGSIVTPDTSPPNVSLVEVRPYRVAAGDTIRYGRRAADRLYLRSLDGVAVHARAYDGDSDVRSYEYAVGSTPGASDLVSFRPLVGTRQSGANPYVNTRVTATLRALELPHGQDAYVTVRATNGEGLTDARTFSTPVRYDSTAPPALTLATQSPAPPARRLLSLFGGADASATLSAVSPSGSAGPLRLVDARQPVYQLAQAVPPVYAPPPLASPSTNADGSPGERSLVVSWNPVDDSESGLLHYAYVLSSTSDPQAARFVGTTQGASVRFENGLLSFNQPRYVHVQAVNGAGAAGPVQTLPIVVPDLSRPSTPSGALVPRADALQFWLTQFAEDDQTGISGYQLAWGTSPGASNLRSFPDVDDEGRAPLDYPALDEGGNRRRVLGVSKADLPLGVPIYVSVRAVNGQGMPSAPTVSGPVVLSGGPPQPSFSVASFDTEQQRMDLRIHAVPNAPGGLVRASYRIQEVVAVSDSQGRTGGIRIVGGLGSGSLANVEETFFAAGAPQAQLSARTATAQLTRRSTFAYAAPLPPGDPSVSRAFDVSVTFTGGDGSTSTATQRFVYKPPLRYERAESEPRTFGDEGAEPMDRLLEATDSTAQADEQSEASGARASEAGSPQRDRP
jgi:hypothetical protein